jgi:hypothetical protein
MTLLRDLIDIPTSVGDADFVVRASGTPISAGMW